jgi:hypothetical protein
MKHVSYKPMKTTLLIAALILGSPELLAAQKYQYVSYSVPDDYYRGKDTFTIDLALGYVYADHGSQRIRSCSAAEPIHCFYGASINFAVPRNGRITVGQTWQNRGKSFRVIRMETIEMLGTTVDVAVIESEIGKDRVDYFYYSNTQGLVGIKFADRANPPTRFLIARSSSGFPK